MLMKMNNLLLFITAASLLLLSACGGLPRARTRDFSAHAPLALVTVVSNQDIYWYGENIFGSSNDAMVTTLVREQFGFGSGRERQTVRISDASELINEAEQMLTMVLSESGVFGLVDRELVLNSASYIAAGSDTPRRRNVRQVAAQGYRFIEHNDRQFAARLSQELGVNSLLFVTFDFNKDMASGLGKTGTCRARVRMEAVLVDSSGRRLFRDEINTFSVDRISVRNGTYYQEELMYLLREAIGEACLRFIWQFSGTR